MDPSEFFGKLFTTKVVPRLLGRYEFRQRLPGGDWSWPTALSGTPRDQFKYFATSHQNRHPYRDVGFFVEGELTPVEVYPGRHVPEFRALIDGIEERLIILRSAIPTSAQSDQQYVENYLPRSAELLARAAAKAGRHLPRDVFAKEANSAGVVHPTGLLLPSSLKVPETVDNLCDGGCPARC